MLPSKNLFFKMILVLYSHHISPTLMYKDVFANDSPVDKQYCTYGEIDIRIIDCPTGHGRNYDACSVCLFFNASLNVWV